MVRLLKLNNQNHNKVEKFTISLYAIINMQYDNVINLGGLYYTFTMDLNIFVHDDILKNND